MKLLIKALGISTDRLRDYFEGVVTQATPTGATTTLEAWFEMLGLKYDPTLTTATKQRTARQVWVATGGLAIGKLEETIQIAFPGITLTTVSQQFLIQNMAGVGMAGLLQATDYPSWVGTPPDYGAYPIHYFYVSGTVDDVPALYRLYGFLDRVKPAHMEPIYSVTVLNVTPTAQAGLGMTGLMMVGRE